MKTTRKLAAVGISITMLGLASCSSGNDTSSASSASLAESKPEMVDLSSCSGVNIPGNEMFLRNVNGHLTNGNSLARCVPGFGVLTMESSDEIEKMLGIDPNSGVTAKTLSWQIVPDNENSFGVLLADVRTPSSGLSPASNKSVLIKVDLRKMEPYKKWDAPIGAKRLVVGSGNVVAVDNGSTETTPNSLAVTGVDLDSGKPVWTIPGSIAMPSSELEIAVTTGNAIQIDSYNSSCTKSGRYDLKSGAPKWEYDAGDQSQFPFKKYCPTINGGTSWGDASYTRISIRDNETNHGNTENVIRSNDTGAVTTIIPKEQVSSSAAPSERRDPLSDLSVVYSTSGPTAMFMVVDRKKDQVVYQIPTDQVAKLNPTSVAIFDKQIYLTTNDGTSTVDATNGKSIGSGWTKYPVAVMNGYTIYSDKSIEKRQ